MAVSWWHQMPDVWVVESKLGPSSWMGALGIIVPYLPSGLLVLRLADNPPGRWGVRMKTDNAKWFKLRSRVAAGATPRLVKCALSMQMAN
jgi:hypothetical protein